MLRNWQKESFAKIQKCNSNSEHNAIPVNACVGSGKTLLAALGFGDFIDKHIDEKTVQMFITPRIKLCKQQLLEIGGKIQSQFPTQDFLKGDTIYQLIPVDCTQDCYNKKNPHLSAQHVIFIVCEASLWGNDKNEPLKRWNEWKNNFDAWEKQGYIFGNIAFDESHNYKDNEKIEKMFGQTIFQKGMQFNLERRSLIHWFKNIMLLSGTPAAYQKGLSRAFPKNVCNCPLNLAIKGDENGPWICSPILNLVRHNLDSAEKIYSNAVIQVVKHEQKLNPANGVRLLVNFNSIDEIAYFTRDKYIKKNKGKLFHLYTIHSGKTFNDKQYKGTSLFGLTEKPMIDDEEMSSGDVYDRLGGNIDKGIKGLDEQKFDKPVIVCQVAMIGEGINISSFNSVITKSNSDTTAMQQIGRVLRRFPEKERPNVYCLYDNLESLQILLSNLMLEHNLTSDCFSWGDKIDISTGSSLEEKSKKETADMTSIGWSKIDPNFDAEIVAIEYSDDFQKKSYHKDLSAFMSTDEFDEITKYLKSFPLDLLDKSIAKSKTNDDISKEFRKANNAAKREAKKTAINIQKTNKNEKSIEAEAEIDVKSNEDHSVEYSQTIENPVEEKQEKQQVDTIPQNAVIQLIYPIKLFILKHKDSPKIIENAKKNLSALTDYLFSYSPKIAQAIKDCNLNNCKAFRKAIGL